MEPLEFKDPDPPSAKTHGRFWKPLWTMWPALLKTLPVALTVLATAFAGMSSSEMSQAMYYRSLAAQQQSKAGDQWAYFQAKRIRGTTLESSAELLQSIGHPALFNVDDLSAAITTLQVKLDGAKQGQAPEALSASTQRLQTIAAEADSAKALTALQTGSLPDYERRLMIPVREGRRFEWMVRNLQTDPEAQQLAKLYPLDGDRAELNVAEENARNFDQAMEPVATVVRQIRDAVRALPATLNSLPRSAFGLEIEAVERQLRGFRLATFEFDAKRYRKESDFNRDIALIHELYVFRTGVESDRHRHRSKMFFYSMLVAQAGVTIASLALARQERKSLWVMAAIAGAIALGLSTWVYLSF